MHVEQYKGHTLRAMKTEDGKPGVWACAYRPSDDDGLPRTVRGDTRRDVLEAAKRAVDQKGEQ